MAPHQEIREDLVFPDGVEKLSEVFRAFTNAYHRLYANFILADTRQPNNQTVISGPEQEMAKSECHAL